ncbi:XrtA-associated tyrosine autokinase [Thiohalorhabdus methylotrophus]|uniref:non-specific protein-tyrosine kinase n=1 Tax=Thiohalorhabdus methylotrophus TaxID=3242694 RepID=A0ABV4TUE7_9GAMM
MNSIEKAMDQLGSGPPLEMDPAQTEDVQEQKPRSGRHERPPEDVDIELPYKRLRRRGLLTPSDSESRLAEEYRLIKRPLLLNAFREAQQALPRGNMVMITSALQGEGKSFTAFNLAVSMAMELDYTVLLVDGDLEEASLTRWLARRDMTGFSDLLEDPDRDVSEALLRTDMPRLSLIPAGKRHPQATELLASGQMAQVTEEISQRYPDRIILFDSPPLLVTSQSTVLAGAMGQVLLVVESGRTPQHLVHEAMGLLDTESQWVGSILNKGERFSSGSYYGGYYGQYG